MASNIDANAQYHQLINDMLSELSSTLDEHVVSKVMRGVKGVTLSDEGKVISLTGEPQEIVQEVVNKFLGLSNELVVKTMQPILKQCPWIKIPKAGIN